MLRSLDLLCSRSAVVRAGDGARYAKEITERFMERWRASLVAMATDASRPTRQALVALFVAVLLAGCVGASSDAASTSLAPQPTTTTPSTTPAVLRKLPGLLLRVPASWHRIVLPGSRYMAYFSSEDKRQLCSDRPCSVITATSLQPDGVLVSIAAGPSGGPPPPVPFKPPNKPRWLAETVSAASCGQVIGAVSNAGIEERWAHSPEDVVVIACAGSAVSDAVLHSMIGRLVRAVRFRSQAAPSFYIDPVV